MSYGKSSDERMRGEKVGSGSDFWSPSDGENRIRVMPPATEDQEDFWFKTATHFNVGPDERSVPCPALSGISESCFLCRMVKRLGKGDEDEQAEAEAMGARPRYLISIVDLNDAEAGVQVWPCPVTVFRLLKKFRLMEDEYGDMTNFASGYDIKVDRTGSGINTKYDAIPARQNTAFPSKALLDHRVESVAELYQALKDEELELPNLMETQNFLDDDEMERIYTGASGGRPRTESDDEGDDDDGGEADGSNVKPQATRRSRRSEPEVEEEPEAQDGEDDSEEEEEPPKRQRRSEAKSEDKDESKPGRSRIRGRVRDLS